MPLHFQQQEPPAVKLDLAADSGERLEMGLAADQAERARIRAKWERRHGWVIAGTKFVDTWSERVIWTVGILMGVPTVIAVISGLGDLIVMIPVAGLLTMLAIASVAVALQGLLERMSQLIRRAALREHVDLSRPD